MSRLFLFSIFFVYSCNLINSFNYIETARNLVLGFDDFEITQEYYNSQSFSFAKVRFGSGPPVIVTLAEVENNRFLWVSSDRSFIYTENGRVTQTIGLPRNSRIINSESEESFTFLYENPDGAFRAYRDVIKVPSSFIYSYRGNEIEVTKFIEKITIPELDLEHKNTYLYGKNGLVFTEQIINPYLDPIRIEFHLK